MKKDMIFFAASGLTNTSANHLANLAKEYIQSRVKKLDNLTLVQERVELISGQKSSVIQEGAKNEDILSVPEMLREIAKAKSLIAWLREAIKARENLIKEANALTVEEYCDQNNLEYPILPDADHVLTEDEYYGELSIKERNRYYQLETEAAVIGEYIHPDGAFSNARDAMKEALAKPHRVVGSGRDALIYSYAVTVSQDLVESQFFELQKKHREVQAALNSIKYECEKAILDSRTASTAKYTADMKVYRAKMQEITAAFQEHQHKRVREIGKLKIVIPDSLQDIYQTISGLGKKSKSAAD